MIEFTHVVQKREKEKGTVLMHRRRTGGTSGLVRQLRRVCLTHIAISPCELQDLSILTSEPGIAIPTCCYFMHMIVLEGC